MAYSNHDYERICADVQRLDRAVHHFQQAIIRGVGAIKEISDTFETVGAALCEMTAISTSALPPPAPPFGSGTDSAAPRTASELETEWDSVSQAGTAIGSVAGERKNLWIAQMHSIAAGFAENVREIREGIPFQHYNTGLNCDVVKRLLPVTEHLKIVKGGAKKYSESLEWYKKYKSAVEKEEKKYTKQGKSFMDQESYKKYASKRDTTWKAYAATRDQFFNSYETLMEVQGHAAAHLVHRCLSLNGDYLRSILGAVERVLPLVEEVYPMSAEFGSLAPSIVAATAAAAAATATATATATAEGEYEGEDKYEGEGKYEGKGKYEGEGEYEGKGEGEGEGEGAAERPSDSSAAEDAADDVRPAKTLEDYGAVVHQWQQLRARGPGPVGGEGPMPGQAEAETEMGAETETGMGAGGMPHTGAPGALLCSVETAPARAVSEETAGGSAGVGVPSVAPPTSYKVWSLNGEEGGIY